MKAKQAAGDASGSAKDVAGDAKGAAKSATGDVKRAAKDAAGSVNEASGNLSANPLDDAIGKVLPPETLLFSGVPPRKSHGSNSLHEDCPWTTSFPFVTALRITVGHIPVDVEGSSNVLH